MNHCDEKTFIDAPADEVYALLSDTSRVDEWAIEFCQQLDSDGEAYRVLTPTGWNAIQIDRHPDAGYAALRTGPDEDHLTETMHIRVTPTPDHRSHVQLLYMPSEPMPDEMHEELSASLKREFEHLRGLFS